MIERLQALKDRFFPPPEKPKREYGSSIPNWLVKEMEFGIAQAEHLRYELITHPDNFHPNNTKYETSFTCYVTHKIGVFHNLPAEDPYKITDDLVRHVRQIMGVDPFEQKVEIKTLVRFKNGISYPDAEEYFAEQLKNKNHPKHKEAKDTIKLLRMNQESDIEYYGPFYSHTNYEAIIDNRWRMEFEIELNSKKNNGYNKGRISLVPIITEEDLVILNEKPKRSNE